jgi:hypothetical protein
MARLASFVAVCLALPLALPLGCHHDGTDGADGTNATASGDAGGDSRPAVWSPPPTFGSAASNQWGILTDGLPADATPYHLGSAAGTTYLSADTSSPSTTGVYTLDAQALRWNYLAPGPEIVGQLHGEMTFTADGKLYTSRGTSIVRLDGTTWTTLAAPPLQSGETIAALRSNPSIPDALFAFNDLGNGTSISVSRYTPSTDTWTPYAPATTVPPVSDVLGFGTFAVRSDGGVYCSATWAPRDSMGMTGAVFRWAPGDADWVDASFNLRDTDASGLPVYQLNQTGNGWGPFGGVTIGPGMSDAIVGSSEQGTFELSVGTDTWQWLSPAWGNSKMFPSPAYLFLSQNETVYMMPTLTSTLRLGQTELYGCTSNGFSELTSPDTSVVAGILAVSNCAAGHPDFRALLALRIDPNAPVATRDLELAYASHGLSTPGSDDATAAAISLDGSSVALAGSPAGQGEVWRLPVAGGAPTASLAFPSPVTDMAQDPGSGDLIAAGDFGLARIPADLSAPSWTTPIAGSSGETRVDVGASGTIVTLTNKQVTVWTKDGVPGPSVAIGYDYVEDVAVSDAEGLVYVVGFANQRYQGTPVQVAFLQALAISDLSVTWKTWGYDPTTLANDLADTRLYRVTVGADGRLYVLGQSAGGNTIYRWNGRDLSTQSLVEYDLYNSPTNLTDANIAYYARLDAATGDVLAGQFAIPRNSGKGDQGNTFDVSEGSIVADASGRVLIGGISAYQLAGREAQLLDGQPVSAYAGGDASLLLVAPDFSERLRWTTLSQGGSGVVRAVALAQGHAAAFSRVESGTLFVTDGTPAPNAGDSGVADVHVALWAD